MAANSNNNDPMRALSGKAAIFMAVFVVMAIVAFQAFGKHLDIDQWASKMVGAAFLYVIYYYWRRGKGYNEEQSESDFKPLILHIEDNPVQQQVFKYGLRKSGLDFDLQVADSAEKALDNMTRPDFLLMKPDIIVLDLGLPGMSGQDFLEKIKTNRDLCHIPVVILSSTARSAAARPEILDTCRFYIERGAGIEALKEAILSCDPRVQRSPFEMLSQREEKYRKSNHQLRTALNGLINYESLSPGDRARAIEQAKQAIHDSQDLSGVWRLPNNDK